MSGRTYVIVGGGLAGAKAAEELRHQGFDGRVVLIGAEPERPYERPPLTKGYLRAESARETVYVHDAAFYETHEIELLTGTRATQLDARAARLTLEDGRELSYDRLLLATGAEPRRLPVPGAELAGVHYLRTLSDCDALRERLSAGGRVVVVGGGWIGSEFSASARQLGMDVTLIDPLPLPNARIFGPEIAAFYRDVHAEHGVALRLGTGVEAFEGHEALSAVRTSDGQAIECELALVGIGVRPHVELAAGAGAHIEDGVRVDDRLQTTLPNVFAAGDVASAFHPRLERHVRVEHWANALNQGPMAARAMLGEASPYDRVPYFFSDQYDVGMEYCGYAPQWDAIVFRGSPESGRFIAFWMREGRVIAGMNVNVWDVNEHIQALIRSRRVVDPASLADSDTPLVTLADAATMSR